MKIKTTKQLILSAALMLFSEKGFDNVGVDSIAKLAGITGPGIYRYFKSKDEILDTLLNEIEQAYLEKINSFNPLEINSIDELKQTIINHFNYTTTDQTIVRARKLLTIEQFRSSRIASLLTMHSYTLLKDYYKEILAHLVRIKVLHNIDLDDFCFELISPITILVEWSDRMTSNSDEIRLKLKAHLDEKL